MMKFLIYITAILSSSICLSQTTSPPWSYTETEENHVIAIPLKVNPTIDYAPLIKGDYIGVFFESSGALACGGYVMWNDSSNVPVIAWMDRSNTNNIKEGFLPGEVFKWKIWRAADNKEFMAYVVYQEGPEVFTFRGYTVVDSLYKINSINGIETYSTFLPKSFAVEQNYPNPFNPTTNIKFALPKDSKVSIKVYNILGEMVSEVVTGNYQAGHHSVKFDGSRLASGVYFYSIEAGDFNAVKKMILVK